MLPAGPPARRRAAVDGRRRRPRPAVAVADHPQGPGRERQAGDDRDQVRQARCSWPLSGNPPGWTCAKAADGKSGTCTATDPADPPTHADRLREPDRRHRRPTAPSPCPRKSGRLYDDDSRDAGPPPAPKPKLDENLLKLAVGKTDPDRYFRTITVAPGTDRTSVTVKIQYGASLAWPIAGNPAGWKCSAVRQDLYGAHSGEPGSAARRTSPYRRAVRPQPGRTPSARRPGCCTTPTRRRWPVRARTSRCCGSSRRIRTTTRTRSSTTGSSRSAAPPAGSRWRSPGARNLSLLSALRPRLDLLALDRHPPGHLHHRQLQEAAQHRVGRLAGLRRQQHRSPSPATTPRPLRHRHRPDPADAKARR